jgi:hypothetical protein
MRARLDLRLRILPQHRSGASAAIGLAVLPVFGVLTLDPLYKKMKESK